MSFLHANFNYLSSVFISHTKANDYKKRQFSTLGDKLNPWWISGFVDAEGSFILMIMENSKRQTGWKVELKLSIELHQKDRAILEAIQNSFGGIGRIYDNRNGVCYTINSNKDFPVIINHFDLYPLITQKHADYLLFKQAFDLIKNKKHLIDDDILNLVCIKASMNLGLSEELKIAFPKIKAVQRPKVFDQTIKDPQWLAGFTSGEGCFLVKITSSKTHTIGFQIELRFTITQHDRDEELLRSFVSSPSAMDVVTT